MSHRPKFVQYFSWLLLALLPLLAAPATHIFICGLKGMEEGVDAALAEIATGAGLDWGALKPLMRGEGRYHVETY